MYYAIELFGRKGQLGKMWLAGTVGWRKLSKNAICSSNIKKMAEDIKNPPVPLALPTQATLLRGVCRIQGKQSGYLLSDALDAQNKLNVAEKVSTVDLKVPNARFESITLREGEALVLDDLDAMVILEGDIDALLEMSERQLPGDFIDLSMQQEKARKQRARNSFTARAEDISLTNLDDDVFMNMGHHVPPDGLDGDMTGVLLDLDDFGAMDPSIALSGQGFQGRGGWDNGIDVDFDVNQGDGQFHDRDSLDLNMHPELRLLQASMVGDESKGDLTIDEGEERLPVRQKRARRKRRRGGEVADRLIDIPDAVMAKNLSDVGPITGPPEKRYKVTDAQLLAAISQPAAFRLFGKGKYGVSTDLLNLFRSGVGINRTRALNNVLSQAGSTLELGTGGVGGPAGDHNSAFMPDYGGQDVDFDVNQGDDMPKRGGYSFDNEVEKARRRSSLSDGDISRSFLGRSLEDNIDLLGDRMEDPLEGSRRQSRNRTRDSILPFDMPEDDGELGANVTQGSILLTPDLDAPFSQFQIPMRGEAKNPLGAQTLGQPQQGKQGARQKISKVTEIFRRILEDAFVSSGKKLGARFAGHGTVTFNSALKDAVADELLSVKDVAISFVQLLSLKSLNVIDIQQEVPYGAIAISKGPQWKHHARRVDDVFLSPSQEL